MNLATLYRNDLTKEIMKMETILTMVHDTQYVYTSDLSNFNDSNNECDSNASIVFTGIIFSLLIFFNSKSLDFDIYCLQV